MRTPSRVAIAAANVTANASDNAAGAPLPTAAAHLIVTNAAVPLTVANPADSANDQVTPVAVSFPLLSERHLRELDCNEKGEVWYRPMKYPFYQEFTNLDAAKKHLQADRYHWNVKGLNSYTWKTKDVIVHILGCEDKAIAISGLHRAEDKVDAVNSRSVGVPRFSSVSGPEGLGFICRNTTGMMVLIAHFRRHLKCTVLHLRSTSPFLSIL